VEGKDKLFIKLDALVNAASLTKGLTKAALRVEKTAREECPSDDGALRASITHAVAADGLSAEVGTPLHYAPYVEFGTGIYASKGDGRKDPWSYQDDEGKWHYTRGMHPNPFLGSALDMNRLKIKKDIAESLKEEISK
jgi:HK97 gp10 family phage protein